MKLGTTILLLALGCAGSPREWVAEGEPKQAGWEYVAQAAFNMAPCRLDDRWGGTITFHPAPFDCGGAFGTQPGQLCNGLSTIGQIDVNGNQTTDVLAGTLPYEMASVLGMVCWPHSYVEGPWNNVMAAIIVQEARTLMEAK
jgi:hypothetical protein